MKSTMLRMTAMLLVIIMCAACFAACGAKEDAADTTTAATTTAATTTEATTEATTTEATTEATTTTTKATTTTTTEPPAPEITAPAEGLLVYYEDFNSYANSDDTAAVLKAIGFTELSKEKDGVYSESDPDFAIIDGRLYYDNYKTDDEKAALTAAGDTRVTGKDCYFRIDKLVDDYMRPVVTGKYTLQYDLEYTASGNISRYTVLITECSADGQCYNSFHFRIGGYGNNQCHFYGSWKTHDAFDASTDLSAASQAADAETAATKGSPICFKLLGTYYDKTVKQFQNLPVTVKLQWNPEAGHTVYMKTATMTDFVKVSEPSVNADGGMYLGWDGWAVQLKLGATIDGYIDNIALWTGWGEKPVGTTITYKPAA